jgi:azurin
MSERRPDVQQYQAKIDTYKTVALYARDDEEQEETGSRKFGLGALIISGVTAMLLALVLLFTLAGDLDSEGPSLSNAKPVARARKTPISTPTPAVSPTPTAAPALAIAPAAIEQAMPAPQPAAEAARLITISTAREDWLFDPATLEATAGEAISLTFENGSSQRHNWVLVRGGEEVANEVNAAGAEAGRNAGYLPADRANVVASTGLLRGGERETVSFTAPEAGIYTFMCSVPGHFDTGMGGMLIVQ